jgi:hypothetical protein
MKCLFVVGVTTSSIFSIAAPAFTGSAPPSHSARFHSDSGWPTPSTWRRLLDDANAAERLRRGRLGAIQRHDDLEREDAAEVAVEPAEGGIGRVVGGQVLAEGMLRLDRIVRGAEQDEKDRGEQRERSRIAHGEAPEAGAGALQRDQQVIGLALRPRLPEAAEQAHQQAMDDEHEQHAAHRADGAGGAEALHHGHRGDHQRQEGDGRGDRRERAGTGELALRQPFRLDDAVAGLAVFAPGEAEMHAVGIAEDHHQRRHDRRHHGHLDAEQAHEADHGHGRDDRRCRRQDRGDDGAEDDQAHHRADQRTDDVEDDLVVADDVGDRIADHRKAGDGHRHVAAGKHVLGGRLDLVGQPAGDCQRRLLLARRDGEDDRRAVGREQPVAEDRVGANALDQVGGQSAGRVGDDRRRVVGCVRRVAQGEKGIDGVDAVDELQFELEVLQLLEILGRTDVLALNQDEQLVLRVDEIVGGRHIVAESLGVAGEDVAQVVVEAEVHHAVAGKDGDNQQDAEPHARALIGKQSDALQAETDSQSLHGTPAFGTFSIRPKKSPSPVLASEPIPA